MKPTACNRHQYHQEAVIAACPTLELSVKVDLEMEVQTLLLL